MQYQNYNIKAYALIKKRTKAKLKKNNKPHQQNTTKSKKAESKTYTKPIKNTDNTRVPKIHKYKNRTKNTISNTHNTT